MITKKLHYYQLTNYQKKNLLNGCGPKGGWFKIPDFIFTASCYHHDFKYWRGCGPKIFSFKFLIHFLFWFKMKCYDRKISDMQFRYYMMSDAMSEPDLELRNKYISIGNKYYFGVRIFGWMFYNWGKEKTLDNLLQETK